MDKTKIWQGKKRVDDIIENLRSMNGGNPVCPDCLTYDNCAKHADKLNPPIGNTHSAVNSEPVVDTACSRCGQINGFHLDNCMNIGKVPIDMNRVDYVGTHFCKTCGSAFQNYEQGWYDEYTGKKMFKWGCSKYGCDEHCYIIGGCIYTQKHFWSALICERCGHKWGEYN